MTRPNLSRGSEGQASKYRGRVSIQRVTTATPMYEGESCGLAAVLVELIDADKHVAGFAPIRRAEDPSLVELVDDPSRPSVPDLEFALKQRSRSALVLNARLGGLPE